MKFLHINNSICNSCDRCLEGCPSGSIFTSNIGYYINYDKCVLCGSCIKICTTGAISMQSLEQWREIIERTEEYKSRIGTLEHELIESRSQEKQTKQLLSDILRQTPVATFIADSNNNIIIANKPLIELLETDPAALAQMPEDLHGEAMENIFTDATIKLIQLTAGDKQTQCEIIGGSKGRAALYISRLNDGTILGFARDLSDPQSVNEEIVARLKETIDRKLSMVQKIGFLLGEEVSVVVNNLNSVIKIIESCQDKSNER